MTRRRDLAVKAEPAEQAAAVEALEESDRAFARALQQQEYAQEGGEPGPESGWKQAPSRRAKVPKTEAGASAGSQAGRAQGPPPVRYHAHTSQIPGMKTHTSVCGQGTTLMRRNSWSCC
jgi:hypothetical protein